MLFSIMCTFPERCGRTQKTGGHPHIWNTLSLWWSLLAPSAPNHTAAVVKWGRDSIFKKKNKKNKASLCRPVEESVQTAVACQLGTQSVIGHPAAFWKCTGITKSICVWRWEIGIGKCSLLHPPSPHHCLHETVGEQWNTCGPEWYNNNFVSPGNDAFPDLGNRRAGDRQLGRQIFTISLMP